jgi:NAD(P) transhydrogenase subunit alpha
VIIGVPKELCPGEKRVALIPANVATLTRKGLEVIVEAGAGIESGYSDQEYQEAGAQLENNRDQVFQKSDIVILVQAPGSNTETGDADLAALKQDQIIIGMMDPLANPGMTESYAKAGVTSIAMEMIPRITRAQSMDVLSSMATISGYKAVLLAAEKAPRMFPMFMTAAGTVKPARVFIMGAGVAGLQACATAKRLGAVVEAYDVRPAAREQIISVGAKPVELDLKTESAEGSGGYAKEQSEEFLNRQRELMTQVISEQDVVITTAAVPGAKSPILVTADMVRAMKPGSVIVDLAAERGGNCELTKLDEVVVENGVSIYGPKNVPSTAPYHASQMYGKNVENLLGLLIDKEGNLNLDFEDEIVRDTTTAHKGEVVNARMRDLLGLGDPKPEAADSAADVVAEKKELEEA